MSCYFWSIMSLLEIGVVINLSLILNICFLSFRGLKVSILVSVKIFEEFVVELRFFYFLRRDL